MPFVKQAKGESKAKTATLRGKVTEYKNRDDETVKRYEASVSGFFGADNRVINATVTVQDLRDMADDAEAEGFDTVRFAAWGRASRFGGAPASSKDDL